MRTIGWMLTAAMVTMGVMGCSVPGDDDTVTPTDPPTGDDLASTIAGDYTGSGILSGNISTSLTVSVTRVSANRVKFGGDSDEFEVDLIEADGEAVYTNGASITVLFDLEADPITLEFVNGTDTFDGAKQ